MPGQYPIDELMILLPIYVRNRNQDNQYPYAVRNHNLKKFAIKSGYTESQLNSAKYLLKAQGKLKHYKQVGWVARKI